MIRILGFIFCLMVQVTLALFVNLRILQFYKKNVDVKNAFKTKDLNLCEALQLSKNYNEIIERG